jgi:hypothetical protein
VAAAAAAAAVVNVMGQVFSKLAAGIAAGTAIVAAAAAVGKWDRVLGNLPVTAGKITVLAAAATAAVM